MQQFLLMLLATTISIVLTFGTSAFLDKRKKEAEKKEMVMMIIFSSNIETFNTLGNVNFVHEVSSFYNMRHLYQNVVIDSYKQELSTYGVRSVESLFQIDFPEHYFTGKSFLKGMKVIRDRCMQMIEEMREAEEIISRARERKTSVNP
ncbi:MAG: hypothetical protein J6X51_07970 [Bacteroidales bacterium]|nr:hypothetical protein [Bacteroidales bacterium]